MTVQEAIEQREAELELKRIKLQRELNVKKLDNNNTLSTNC